MARSWAVVFLTISIIYLKNASAAGVCQTPSQYKGKVSITSSGKLCQDWISQKPQAHDHGSKDSEFPDGSVSAAKNYCRDPDNTGYPWCYTANPAVRWEGCKVNLCDASIDPCASNPCPSGTSCQQYSNAEYICICDGYTGSSCPTSSGVTPPSRYTGRVSTTIGGRTCQSWASQSPQQHTIGQVDAHFPVDGSIAAAKNYCRDPDNSGFLWCYTTDPGRRWEYCSVDISAACTLPSKYKGTIASTVNGRQCQAWLSQSPQSHSAGTLDSQFPDGSVAAAKNYCRDPDNTGYPWCYTTDPAVRWASCGVNLCAENCIRPAEYTGKVSVTESGKRCQPWALQSPQAHSNTRDNQYADGSVAAAKNYCRDPDNTGYPWCYTTDPAIRWERCNVDLCGNTKNDVCASNPCPVGQVCAQLSNTAYICSCPGYTGTACPIGQSCITKDKYVGTVSVSKSGKTCQAWTSQVPQSHSAGTLNSQFPDGSVADAKNYCRDPDNTGYLWCYTTDPALRWEGCNVDLCTNYATLTPNKYLGRTSVTVNGRTCQNWSAQSPHQHTIGSTDDKFLGDGSVAAAKNYCRDPSNSGFLWCYTSDPSVRWEPCKVDLKACALPKDYAGTVSTTFSGKICQSWTVQTPQAHTAGTQNNEFPDGSVAAAKNYCRDPDNTGYPWCYTTDPGTRWQACSADTCPPANPCENNPCGNGGQCTPSGSGFKCACSLGFSGDTCDTVVPDPCDKQPCTNGGSCSRNGNTEFSCSCPDGYTGATCQTVTGPCSSSPCQNGGTCTNVGSTDFSCDCPDDYNDGDTCAQYQDPCTSKPCFNGGSCIRVSYIAFTCSCKSDYYGSYCELKKEIPPCENKPCLNGGTCTDLSTTTYRCQCPSVWEGQNCGTVHCLKDATSCTGVAFGRYAACSECGKFVVCRAKKQKVKTCNSLRPSYDRTLRKCTTSSAVCAGL